MLPIHAAVFCAITLHQAIGLSLPPNCMNPVMTGQWSVRSRSQSGESSVPVPPSGSFLARDMQYGEFARTWTLPRQDLTYYDTVQFDYFENGHGTELHLCARKGSCFWATAAAEEFGEHKWRSAEVSIPKNTKGIEFRALNGLHELATVAITNLKICKPSAGK